MTPEGKVKARLRKLAKRLLGIYRCAVITSGMGTAGTPDELWCVNGRFIGVEVKAAENKRPTKLQTLRLREILIAGGLSFVVHKDNIEAFERFIEAMRTAPDCGQIEAPPSLTEWLK
jgi:hypothetical protein